MPAFNYHHKHTSHAERLAFLDGWALERIDCAPQFPIAGEVVLPRKAHRSRGFTADLADAFEAGKQEAAA